MKDYLYALRNSGAKLGLERMRLLAEELDNPQKSFRAVLVGGTSGKGSTTAMLSTILKESGYRVGTFISPHLSSLTERIMINGQPISEERLDRLITKIEKKIDVMEKRPGFEHPTFFEVVAAAAMLCFKEEKVDFGVLEVGLGGRLDATNIIDAELTVITNISLEHTRILGDTVEKIAQEKAGITRENGMLITAAKGSALETIEKICGKKNCKVTRVGKEVTVKRTKGSLSGQEFSVFAQKELELFTPLMGRHQLENAACAVAAALALDVPSDAIERGIKNTRWPGRMEIIQENPRVILDCAKDAEAATRLRETIEEDFEFRKLILVFGVSSDKNIRKMLSELTALAETAIITEHRIMDRAAEADSVAEIASEYCKNCHTIYTIKDAVKKALEIAGPDDLVLVTGSIFVVGDAREFWQGQEGRLGRGLNEVPSR
jgi:dihydrofolate synthase/folylpolyglutamate synthase